MVRKRFYARPAYVAAVVGVSSRKRASKGPYRPSRDPQIILLVAIVLGAVGLWLFGVMSPATLVGGPSEPVFPFSDQSGDAQVEVSVNASQIDPGDAIEVSVQIDNKPTSEAPVEIGGESYRTGDDGTVVVRLQDPGSYTVRAQTPGGDRSATTTIEVARFDASLQLSVPSTATTGDGVPVRVTHENGSPAAASVRSGGETYRTGPDGVANVTFQTAGTVTVTASKSPTDRYRFADASDEVEVERRAVQLAVSTNETTPQVDDPVELSVVRTDTGTVVNATVVLTPESGGGAGDANETTLVTGADGRVTTSFDRGGSVEIRVTADRTDAVRFVAGETSVDVQKIPVALEVTVTPDAIQEGERATIEVRRAETGVRVPATVSLFGTAYETGSDGRISFPFYVPGEVTVTASKEATARERFEPDSTTFLVEGPEMVLEELSVPDRAQAGGSMEVTATLTNVGNDGMDGDAVVTVGGVTTRSPTTVAAGETKTVTWTVDTPQATGETTVHVAYEEISVTTNVTLEDDTETTNTRRAVRPWAAPGVTGTDRPAVTADGGLERRRFDLKS